VTSSDSGAADFVRGVAAELRESPDATAASEPRGLNPTVARVDTGAVFLPRPLRHGIAFAKAPANALAFQLRSWLRLRRGPPSLANEPKGELFADLPAAARERAARRESDLRVRYGLGTFAARSSCFVYRDGLWRLEALAAVARALPLPPRARLRAVDVGAKDWHYVLPLHRFLSRHDARPPRNVELHGVEIDAHVVTRDLRSRADHAAAHLALLGAADVQYHATDFRRFHRGRFDVVTMFFPFVTRYALLQFGLPLRCFRPAELLRAARAALAPDGVLYAVHQTEAEAAAFGELLTREGVAERAVVPLPAELAPDPQHAASRVATAVAAHAFPCLLASDLDMIGACVAPPSR
jgi:hypothetical protein